MPVIKNNLLFLILFLFSSLGRSDVPVGRDFLNLPDGRWIWLKKAGVHKTWLILGKGKKSVHNRIWSKFYESDGERHTWAYAFFVRLRLDQFIDQDAAGNPKVALSTYDMGNGIIRWAIVYRVLKNRLEIVEEIDNFNVEADESVYEKRFVPRDLLPHFKISDIPKWVGKYSFSRIEGAHLFSIKAINDYLKDILGDTKYKNFLSIEELGPQSPVEFNDGIVHFTVCEKHNCGHTFYFLYEIKSKQLFVCERETGLEPTKTAYWWKATWFSNKGQYTVPEGSCEFYDEIAKKVNWKRTAELIPNFLR